MPVTSPSRQSHARYITGRRVLRREEVTVGMPAHGPHADVLPMSQLVLLEHPDQPVDLDAGAPDLVVLSVHGQDEEGLTSEIRQLARDVAMDLPDRVRRAGDDRARRLERQRGLLGSCAMATLADPPTRTRRGAPAQDSAAATR